MSIRALLSAEQRNRLFAIPVERAEMARHYVLAPDDVVHAPSGLACMCGRLPRRKGILRSDARGRVRSCVRPVDAAIMTAGPDAIRNLVPHQFCALICAAR